MANDIGTIHHTDGSYFQCARAFPHVLETVCQGDGPAGCKLHWHRATDIVLHRCCDLYSDEVEYPKSLDASLGERLYDTRNYAVGIFEQYHVSDPSW